MKVGIWLIVTASIGFILALGALYIVCKVWIAHAQIDAWSQVKYSATPPAAELPIEIVGQQFEWHIRYPSSRRLHDDLQVAQNFARETSMDQGQADDVHLLNELHVWKRGKVQIHLKSADVLHSFYLPVLRIKQDAVPGKRTDVWLESMQSNVTWDPESGDWKHGDEWEFACAEHGSAKMRGQLFVHETKDDFLKWLKGAEAVRLQPPSGQ